MRRALWNPSRKSVSASVSCFRSTESCARSSSTVGSLPATCTPQGLLRQLCLLHRLLGLERRSLLHLALRDEPEDDRDQRERAKDDQEREPPVDDERERSCRRRECESQRVQGNDRRGDPKHRTGAELLCLLLELER